MTESEWLACTTMTEKDWLASVEPWKMLTFLQGRATRRRLRLFAVACCRRGWDHFDDLAYRDAIEVAERWADRSCTGRELRKATALARAEWDKRLNDGVPNGGIGLAALASLFLNVDTAANTTCNVMSSYCPDPDAESDMQCQLLRDIFGNPFRHVTADRPWFTAKVVALAQEIYDNRAFDQMPILAAALQEAGCTNGEILAHCRGPGLHVRGCWVVDLILGKD